MTEPEQARRFALSLPEATEEPHFDKASFRVRGRIFATVPPDGQHLHVFVATAVAAPRDARKSSAMTTSSGPMRKRSP